MSAIFEKVKVALGFKKTKKSTTQPLNRTTASLRLEQANSNSINANPTFAKSTLAIKPGFQHNSCGNKPSFPTSKDYPVFDPNDFSDELVFRKPVENITPIIDETHLFLNLAKVLNIPDDVLKLVSSEFAIDNQILPVEQIGNTVKIAYINNVGKQVAEKLLKAQYPKLEFSFLESTEKFLLDHIHENYSGLNSLIAREQEERIRREQALRVSELENHLDIPKELVFNHSRPLDSEQNKILSLISTCLCQMKRLEGTDLDIDFVYKTLSTGLKDGFLQIRIRVERDLILLHEQRMSLEVFKQIPRVLKVISLLESTDEKQICTGKVKCLLVYGTKKDFVQLRINFLPTGEERGLSISIRLQDRQNFKHNLTNIGLTASQREIIVQEILRKTSGLVLVVGPVNEGKNTTSISIIKENHTLYPRRKIVTVEDPIEYDLPFATQVEVDQTDPNTKSGSEERSYAYYIRGIIRHNINDLYIGEIRDGESASMAAQAANLGHLVVSTLHTNSACEAVARLSAMGISAYQLSNVLRTVISQRLVKKVCTHCVKISDESEKEIPRLREYIQKLGWDKEINFVRGSGRDSQGEVCRNCQGSGYRGVTAIFEILKLSRRLRKLISDSVTSDELKFQAQAEGFKSLWYSGLEKALLGETTLEQIMLVLGGLPDADLEGLAPDLDSKGFYDTYDNVLAN